MERKTEASDLNSDVEVTPRAETLARMENALAQMPERRRAIFLAVRLDGTSYDEIAERIGLSVRQVEGEIAAALLQLDDALCGPSRSPWWRRQLRRIIGGCRR